MCAVVVMVPEVGWARDSEDAGPLMHFLLLTFWVVEVQVVGHASMSRPTNQYFEGLKSQH